MLAMLSNQTRNSHILVKIRACIGACLESLRQYSISVPRAAFTLHLKAHILYRLQGMGMANCIKI